eukprot:6204079-Pleurochrysis_carterae.AAC.2
MVCRSTCALAPNPALRAFSHGRSHGVDRFSGGQVPRPSLQLWLKPWLCAPFVAGTSSRHSTRSLSTSSLQIAFACTLISIVLPPASLARLNSADNLTFTRAI